MSDDALVPVEPVWATIALGIPEGTSIEQWAALGVHLRTALNSAAWWLGDWLIYAYQHYETDEHGNAVSSGRAAVNQHLAELGIEQETRARAWRVAAKFPPADRRDDLSWAHHLEVTPLPLDAALELLDQAAAEGWSTRDLRAAVRAWQAEHDPQPPLPGLEAPKRLAVKFGAPVAPEVLEQATERIAAVLDELGIEGEVTLS